MMFMHNSKERTLQEYMEMGYVLIQFYPYSAEPYFCRKRSKWSSVCKDMVPGRDGLIGV